MTWRYFRFSSVFFVFACLCAAQQPNSVNFTNLNLTIVGTNNTYTTSLSVTGTASFSGLGNATVKGTGSATRSRGLSCGSYVQLNLTFSFVAPDGFNVLLTWPDPVPTTPVPFNIVGGTGAYKGLGGSGTMTVTTTQNSTNNTAVVTGAGSALTVANGPLVASVYPSGIVPVFSTVPIVQPDSWISIYGNNLANTTAVANGGVFPTAMGNVTVTIDGKPGYMWLVSPGQINVQVPDDTNYGCVNVVVATPNGTVNSQVTLQPQQPSFSLMGDNQHIVGVIPVSTGLGAYGGGTYDLAGPVGAFPGVTTRPVKAGETVVLYGVGFGPIQIPVAAGAIPGAPIDKTTILPNVTIGGVQAQVAFSGLVGVGLYQLNVVVPSVPSGDRPILATLSAPNPILFSADTTQNCNDPDPEGSMPTGCTVYLTVQ